MKYLITAALPYANGNLHIGHLRSTYVPADSYCRLLKMSGEEARYICASDEHGTPIEVSALNEGKTPKEYVDLYYEVFKKDFQDAGIQFDIFSRTTHPTHYEMTQKFFNQLKKNGHIFKEKVQQFYCEKDDRPLPDRYVKGSCPSCGASDQYGDYCENCSSTYLTLDIKDPRCTICGAEPNIVDTDHYFFNLKGFQGKLAGWLESKVQIQSDVKNHVKNWLKGGLRNWDITRDINWGVPVPREKNKVFYVWFDAPISYISSTRLWAEENNTDWKEYWKASDTKIVHFIGKDIIYHHCLFWPAMLMGMEDYNLPSAISARGFATLEGQKMSKSRKWYIDLHSFLENFPSDFLRFYWSATTRQAMSDGDFSLSEFKGKTNKILIGGVSNFVNRTLTLIDKYYRGNIPSPSHFDEEDTAILGMKEKLLSKFEGVIKNIELKEVLDYVIDITNSCNKYLNNKEPWKTVKTDQERTKTTLYVCADTTMAISMAMAPYTPAFSREVWAQCGHTDDIFKHQISEILNLARPPKIGKPKPILKPVEEERFKNLVEKQ